MPDDADETLLPDGEQPSTKRSRLPLVLGILLFLLATGGGFYASFSGLFSVASFLGESKEAVADVSQEDARLAPTYVALGEIVVPLGPNAEADYLLLSSEIETSSGDAATFQALRPRIQDLFNTYLRAVEARDLEKPNAMMRLRDQLLRRIRVIAEPAVPRDLLFTSFILK